MTTDPIEQAAMWLAEQKEHPENVMKYLRDNFALTASEAAKACTLANTFRSERSTRK
ncbi:hypothetical protein [Rhizobium nepotum]|uniref:hypothetical protein n=1 Tax=Rhizobium nepotum TaxID=1035271 RepID=UPI003CFA877B